MLMTDGNVFFLAHLGKEVQEITQRERFAGACFAPDGQMAGMITPQNAGKVAGEFLDFGIPDIGIEYLLKDTELFGTNELLIVEKTPILDNSIVYHVLDSTYHFGADIGWLHWKNTSICV
jgi:hypothetical protein